MFRDSVDAFVDQDGQVAVVPAGGARQATDDAATYDAGHPATGKVPPSLVRDHERVELECDHLREQLSEYKQYVTRLEAHLDEGRQAEAELVRLEAVDAETGTSLLLE